MNSCVVFGLLLVVICALSGTTNARDKACLEIAKCLGSDFNRAVKDKKGGKAKLCQHFKKAIDCMNPKIEECLPTVDASMGNVFTQQRDQMQENMMSQCKDQPGIASSSGCDMDKFQECTPLIEAMKTAGKKGKAALCGSIKTVKECLAATKCGAATTGEIEAMMAQMETQVKCDSNGAANTGYDPAKHCDISACRDKKDCEMFKCVMGAKKTCEATAWDELMKDPNMKKNYDTLAEKCGCGSLKASLLIVLASAILMFFRF